MTGGVNEAPEVGRTGLFCVGDGGGALVVVVAVVVVVVGVVLVLDGALFLFPPHATLTAPVARIATVTATPPSCRANRCDVIAASPVHRAVSPG